MPSLIRFRPLEWLFVALMVFSVLWRGGKSIDATWILAAATASIVLLTWLKDRFDTYGGADRAAAGVCPAWIRGLLLGAVGWSILSYLTSDAKNYGLDEILRTVSYALAFFIVIRQRERGLPVHLSQSFPGAIAGTAVVASLIGAGVYILQPVTRFSGTFFDARFHTDYWPNAWAEFLLIALPMTLVCAMRAEKRKWIWSVAAGFLCSGMFLSFSRGGMIALAGEIILLLLIIGIAARLSEQHTRERFWSRTLAGHLLLIAVIAGTSSYFLNTARSQRYDLESFTSKATFTASEGTSSVDERAQFWSQAMDMIAERPILGWGPYSFRFVQPAAMTSVLATSDHPHNSFLKMAAERGLPAALLFSLFILSILLLAASDLLKKDRPFSDSPLKIGALIAVCGVIAHTMIDYNLQFTGVGLPLFALLGFLVPLRNGTGLQTASFGHWKRRQRLNDSVAALAGLLLFVTIWEGMFLVTSSFGRHAEANGDTDGALVWYERSAMELFSRDLLLSEASLKADKGDTDGALRAVEQYLQLNPHDPRAWKIRGSIQLSAGNVQSATDALEIAYENGKYTDAGILRLLLQTVAPADPTAYKSRKTEFDALFVAYADAIIANTHFIALSANVEELQQTARILGRLFPSDAERYLHIAREAQRNAQKEREGLSSREPGVLW